MTCRTGVPLAGSLMSLAAALMAGAQPLPIEPTKPFMPEGRPLEGLAVTLDAAGGGAAADPNAPRVGGFSADELNMLIAGHLYHHLKHAGATVHLTRWDDRAVAPGRPEDDLAFRARRGVDTRSHLLVSIRIPADQPDQSSGVRVRTQPDSAATIDGQLLRRLAEQLGEGVLQRVPAARRFDVRIGECPLAAVGEVPTLVVEIGRLRSADFARSLNDRGEWRTIAIGLYEGIVCLWGAERGALDARRAERFPSATIGASTQPASADELPNDPPNGIPRRVRQAVADLWRSQKPPQTAADAEWSLAQYFRRTLTDRTFFHIRTQVTKDGDRWTIHGATNFARLAGAAVSVLREAGCGEVSSEIEQLPSGRLGDERFGVVTATMAMTWAEPREGAAMQTQLLLGERVFLLDESPDRGYLFVHASDGYVGWVRAEAIRRMTAAPFNDWGSHRAAVFKRGVVVDGIRIPEGASLPVARGTVGEMISLRLLPSYNSARESDEVLVSPGDVTLSATENPGRAVVAAAAEFMTTPYAFGGRSRLGIDCSGLTGVAYAAAGLTLPRDARQQILVGQLVATPWHRDELVSGDLLFFCDESGSVIHTGISLGGPRFIHSAPPEVQVSSLDPTDPLYSDVWSRAFAFARRPLQQ